MDKAETAEVINVSLGIMPAAEKAEDENLSRVDREDFKFTAEVVIISVGVMMSIKKEEGGKFSSVDNEINVLAGVISPVLIKNEDRIFSWIEIVGIIVLLRKSEVGITVFVRR